MDYEEDEKNWVSLVALIVLMLTIAGGGIYFLIFGAQKESNTGITPPLESPLDPTETTLPELPESNIEESSHEILETIGVKVEASQPADAAAQIAKIFESGDMEQAFHALGGETSGISPQALERLQAMGGNSALRLKQVREVGELEINRRKRFALEWENRDEPIFLDLTRGQNQKWSVDDIRIPQSLLAQETRPNTELSSINEQSEKANVDPNIIIENKGEDSLSISDKFLQAALSQDFPTAKSFANTNTVSDAKIAAMCILFEEGKYRLNPTKPLRAMFNRETTAGFLVNVLTDDINKPAQFGVNLTRATQKGTWQVSEINLDALLADYANRVAGGDVHYTPLVPNPQGGETLVIFFGFDEETLAPRTQRQLSIVSDVLKTDPNRKLTLSGHADALGSDDYNKILSQKRAASVRNFLIRKGVTETQIKIIAEGESRPRRPNETASGEDDPDGRRANRRTEIYLDFGSP